MRQSRPAFLSRSRDVDGFVAGAAAEFGGLDSLVTVVGGQVVGHAARAAPDVRG